VSVLYPLSEIDAYSVDTFCTAETFSCVYSIYTADILANPIGGLPKKRNPRNLWNPRNPVPKKAKSTKYCDSKKRNPRNSVQKVKSEKYPAGIAGSTYFVCFFLQSINAVFYVVIRCSSLPSELIKQGQSIRCHNFNKRWPMFKKFDYEDNVQTSKNTFIH